MTSRSGISSPDELLFNFSKLSNYDSVAKVQQFFATFQCVFCPCLTDLTFASLIIDLGAAVTQHSTNTLCPEKSNPLCTFLLLGQMMSDFNKILHEQCDIKLLTNCKISVKSVNNCNSYSGFSAGTQKLKCPL